MVSEEMGPGVVRFDQQLGDLLNFAEGEQHLDGTLVLAAAQ
jgi:hypothetical protein